MASKKGYYALVLNQAPELIEWAKAQVTAHGLPENHTFILHHLTVKFGVNFSDPLRQWIDNSFVILVKKTMSDRRALAAMCEIPDGWLMRMCEFKSRPHITIATHGDGRPVHSNDLNESTAKTIHMDLPLILEGRLKFIPF